MSLSYPRPLAFVSLLALLTVACGPPSEGAWLSLRDQELAERFESSVTPPWSEVRCDEFDAQGRLRCSSSGLTVRERRVLRDEAAWQAAWDAAMSIQSPRPSLPPVDFSREMVVLAAMGLRSSGGHYIEVTDAVSQGEDLAVTVVERSSGRTCATTEALTQPFTAVRVPRLAGEVRFTEYQYTYECGP